MRRILILVLSFGCVTGCGAEPLPHAELTCTVFATCGDFGPGSFGIEFTGEDADQVEQEARDWVTACAAVTNAWVADGQCPYVWCGAVCNGEATQ